jgi:hypothetical protein
VITAYNVTVDASGHPIFWGESEADEDFLLCDGRSDGLGGNVPNMIGRCVRGSLPTDAGQTGGSDSVTLSVAQMPTHSHGASVSTNGDHTHTRGSMNIQGTVSFDGAAIDNATGAFSIGGNRTGRGMGDTPYTDDFSFNAASNWTGETSQNGAHTHDVTIGNTGSGAAVSFEPSNITAPVFMKIAEG